MVNFSLAKIHDGSLPKRAVRTLILTALAIFAIYTATKAFLAAFSNDDFPEGLAVKNLLLPHIFPLHMITGGLALVLLPLVFALRRHRHWHRLLGRIAAIDVLLCGLTAFPVALVAPVTGWSAAGFTMQAATWLSLLVLGFLNIRRGRKAAHRACMLLMCAVTSGALFFRIYLALWAIFGHGRHYELFYACDAWIAWLLPLAVCAGALSVPRQRLTRLI